jgi:hypothetical protein
MTTTFIKVNTEILDYTVDWALWLVTDTISTSTWAVTTGITVASSSNTTTTGTVFLTGGSSGITYTVTNTVVTAGGRTGVRSFYVNVQTQEFA